MKNFENFVNETQFKKGKLYLEEGANEEDTGWKLSINVSQIWQDYLDEKISLLDFNNNYATLLIENQQTIVSSVGESCWSEIEPLAINELREATNNQESENIYDKLYDIYDKNEVLIIHKNEVIK